MLFSFCPEKKKNSTSCFPVIFLLMILLLIFMITGEDISHIKQKSSTTEFLPEVLLVQTELLTTIKPRNWCYISYRFRYLKYPLYFFSTNTKPIIHNTHQPENITKYHTRSMPTYVHRIVQYFSF